MKNSKLIALALVVIAVVLGGVLYKASRGHSSGDAEFTIGVLTDLTSYTAEYGKQEFAGLQVLADENGPGVRLVVQDTKGSPKDAVSGLATILQAQDKPSFLFTALSSVSMAVLPVAEQKDVLVLCNATSREVVDSAKNSIRNFPDPQQEVDFLLDGVVKPRGLRSVALIYVNDEYGKSVDAALRAAVGRVGSAISLSEGYGFDVSDFRSIIDKLKSSGSDSVICVGYGSQVGGLIRQLKESAYKGQVMVTALIVNTDSVTGSAGDALDGVVFNGFDYQSGTQELESFLKAFGSKYGGRQSDIGALAYVGSKLVLHSCESGATPAQTLQRLRQSSPFSTILGEVTFDGRSFIYPLKLYTIRAGSVVAYAP